MTETVVITGATGQLGFELQRSAPAGVLVRPVGRAEFDITRPAALEGLMALHKPTVIINCAAYTAVDRAESEADAAFAVNVAGPAALAGAAVSHGARLIHVSTDFVFGNGAARPRRPSDPTEPLSVYGQTKRDGELAVLGLMPERATVVRTSWLYSSHGANFVKSILRLMRDRDEVRVVADQIGTPTWARSLSEAVWTAVERADVSGVLHWTDAGVASWYDFAVAIQEEALAAGVLSRAVPVTPITSSEFPSAAVRPAYSVLDKTETIRMLGLRPSHWRVNLRQMLTELRHD